MLLVALWRSHPGGRQAWPLTERKTAAGHARGLSLITNTEQLAKHWDETQLGQLMSDPVMEPFAKDLRRQFQDRWSRMREGWGWLDDLKGVPGGEMALAPVHPAAGQGAVALLVDVTGHVTQAQAMLDKVSANWPNRGPSRPA